MVIYISVQKQYNSWFLPDIILTVDPRLLPLGNPFKYHVCSGFVFIVYVIVYYYYYHVMVYYIVGLFLMFFWCPCVVVVVVVFILKAVPSSTQYFLTSVLVN